jgi:hypothetical protein
MSESAIERTVCNKAKLAGWLVRKCKWIGRNGAPDRLFAKGGRMVWIEFKRAGKDAEAHQIREHKRMSKAGLEVHVCDNVEQALWILRIDE